MCADCHSDDADFGAVEIDCPHLSVVAGHPVRRGRGGEVADTDVAIGIEQVRDRGNCDFREATLSTGLTQQVGGSKHRRRRIILGDHQRDGIDMGIDPREITASLA